MRIGLGFNLSIWSMPLVKNKSITGDRKSFRISTAGRWSASWFPQRWLQVGWWQNDKKRLCQNVPLSTVSECICCHRPLRGVCLPLYYASLTIRSNSAPASAWWYHRPLITSQIPDHITDPWWWKLNTESRVIGRRVTAHTGQNIFSKCEE